MLSTSPIPTASSSTLYSNTNKTTSSQQSNDSRTNPLLELIETEQHYIETLKMIDSQIGPIWMKQMTSSAPDFSELLKDIHDILKVNKSFCLKLTKIASNSQAINSLGDVLMQWVDDFEVPYANYCRSYIPNLNGRSDILSNASIVNILKNISADIRYHVNLETLFNAPIEQLKYYKAVYSRLLNSTSPGKGDHKLLVSANKRIDMIMAMAENRLNRTNDSTQRNNITLSPLKTQLKQFSANNESDLEIFQHQVDCSRTVDLYGGAAINHKLQIAKSGIHLIMRNSFIMLPDTNGPSIRVHLVLTNESLVVTRELSHSQFLLLYPPINITDVDVKAVSLDREVVGEYLLQFIVQNRKTITVRADSKEIRNTWIGVDRQAPSSVILSPHPLSHTVENVEIELYDNSVDPIVPGHFPSNTDMAAQNKLGNADIYSFYSDFGGVSPLESSDDEDFYLSHVNNSKSRDTIMDIYDNHFYDFDDEPFPPVPQTTTSKQELANITPQSVKILPAISNVSQEVSVSTNNDHLSATPNKDTFNVNATLPSTPLNKETTAVDAPVKDSSHIQMTYIKAPTAQMATMSISSPIPNGVVDLNKQLPQYSPSPSPSSSTSSSIDKTFAPDNMSKTKVNPVPVTPNRPIITNGMKSNDVGGKPASPRPVEIQRAVVPEMMQAITQNTDDYLMSSPNKLEESSYKHYQNQPMGHVTIPRTSSIRNNQANDAMNTPMRGMNHPQMQAKPLPNQPVSQPISTRSQSSLQPNQYPRGPPPPMHHNGQPNMMNKSLPVQTRPTSPYSQQLNQPRPMLQQGMPHEYMNGPQQRGMPPQQPGMMMPNQYGQNRPPAPMQQQNFRAMPQQNSRGSPSPTMSPSVSQTSARRPNLTPQQSADRFISPSPSMTHLQANPSSDELSSPPHSPSPYNNANSIRQILFSNNQCDVFHWHNHSWYAAEDQCLLQVKITQSNRACVSVQLHSTGELYLNAWILPNTVIRQPSPTDINFSLFMGSQKENYLVHFTHPNDASTLYNLLKKVQQEATQPASNINHLDDDDKHEEEEHVDLINVPQTLKPVMQCKAKLFVKNETSNWSTFGSVTMRISQQNPSLRMMIQIENDKTKLVSAIVKSGNVEKINSKRISFLLVDETTKTSIVYMVHLREDQTGNKIYEYLRTKNAENGW